MHTPGSSNTRQKICCSLEQWPQTYFSCFSCICCIACNLQEAKSTFVIASPKFPWGQAMEKRNEIFISTPCQAYYDVNVPPYDSTTSRYFYAQVAHMRSQLPFTGGITDFLTQALFEPSGFAFDTYLESFQPLD